MQFAKFADHMMIHLLVLHMIPICTFMHDLLRFWSSMWSSNEFLRMICCDFGPMSSPLYYSAHREDHYFTSFAMASAHFTHFSFEMDAMETLMPLGSARQ